MKARPKNDTQEQQRIVNTLRDAMLEQLQAQSSLPHWQRFSVGQLCRRLGEELDVLADMLEDPPYQYDQWETAVRAQCAMVANCCAMLSDRWAVEQNTRQRVTKPGTP